MLYKKVMKVEEKNILIKLFDAYGGLLSEGQKEIMASYINYDFTVSEIAENLGISRQAVKDSVKKAEQKLYDYEDKLLLVKRIENLIEENENLKKKLSKKED